MLHKRYAKSQSAMEYLMTYGWAILIIAVVLGALFQLGVFSGIGTPKAQAGNCQVVKVGSGITQTISLAGECQGQEPEYVAQFSGTASYVNLDMIQQESGTNPITFTVWFNTLSLPGKWPMIFGDTCNTCPVINGKFGYDLYVGGPGSGHPSSINVERYTTGNNFGTYSINTVSLNNWYFAAVTYDGNVVKLYMNGVYQQTSPSDQHQITVNSIMTLGADATNNINAPVLLGNYQIANFQVYNTTLSQAEITALYNEGIGGAPIRPQNIVGWWPLNGDTKDYSGNGNNGQSVGITFSSSWTSGYTAP